MDGVTSHDAVADLLGAHALDAVDPDEAAHIEAHLATCPRCDDELRSYRDVTAMFAFSGQEAPERVWDRITASIAEAPELRIDRVAPAMRLVGPSGRAPGRTAARRGRWRRPVAAISAAAAVVVAVLAVQVVRLQDRVDHLSVGVHQIDSSNPTMADVRRALAEPGSRQITMRGLGSTSTSLDAVITPSGKGYVYDANLDPLGPDRVYQLWGVVGSQAISYGLLGTDPRIVSFTAGPGVSTLAVTDEVADGVVKTTQPFVAVGSTHAVS